MKKIIFVITLVLSFTISINVNAALCSECSKLTVPEAVENCQKTCTKDDPCTCGDSCAGCSNASQGEACRKSCGISNTDSAYSACVNRCKDSTPNGGSAYNSCVSQCEGKDKTPGSAGGNVSGGSGNNGTSTPPNNNYSHDITITGDNKEEIDDPTCETLFSGHTGDIIKDVYKIMRFLVPLLLFAMSIKDFGTVILKNDNDGIKKATTTFLKRFVIAVAVLVAPTIIALVLKLLGVKACLI